MCDRPTPIFSMMAVGNVVPLQFGAHDVAIYNGLLEFRPERLSIKFSARSTPHPSRGCYVCPPQVCVEVCVEDYEIGALAFINMPKPSSGLLRRRGFCSGAS